MGWTKLFKSPARDAKRVFGNRLANLSTDSLGSARPVKPLYSSMKIHQYPRSTRLLRPPMRFAAPRGPRHRKSDTLISMETFAEAENCL